MFSYLVARDWGFAPNPFHGYCTLACCKPTIRRVAEIGDIVIGTGTRTSGLEGQLIFAMRITEKTDFASYWRDPRFRRKRPQTGKSQIAFYGDNIYRPTADGFEQQDSHHSLVGGKLNLHNLKKDTGSDHVLISDQFVYFGANAIKLPNHLRNFEGVDLCAPTQGHISRKIFPEMTLEVEKFFNSLLGLKIRGMPANW